VRSLSSFTAFAVLCIPAFSQTRFQLTGDQAAVISVDEEYRVAKMNNNTATLGRILSTDFHETNQNGNTRDYLQTIELWKTFRVTSLTTDSFEVSVTGDTAVVRGSMTEGNAERMLFTRVYIRGVSGWRLLSSMQFRNPRADARLTAHSN
jgi:hypothetical protein